MGATEHGVELAPLTTMRVGGPADTLVTAETLDEVVAAVRAADEVGTPLLLLSGGSNLVIADDGFRGTVVRIATKGVRVESTHDEHVDVVVAAGEVWDDVVARAVAEGWSGIEALSGIPGLAGATPVQNVGAYDQEVAQTITRVRVWDRDERRERQRDLVADAPGRVLVRGGARQGGEVHPLPRGDHGGGPAGDLVGLHAVEVDGHGQGRHLLVGDVPPGVGVDHPVDLLVGEALPVALGADDVHGVVLRSGHGTHGSTGRPGTPRQAARAWPPPCGAGRGPRCDLVRAGLSPRPGGPSGGAGRARGLPRPP